MVECNMRDIFNVGYIVLISVLITEVIHVFFPPEMWVLMGASPYLSTAGLLIMFYASMKYYKEGREGR